MLIWWDLKKVAVITIVGSAIIAVIMMFVLPGFNSAKQPTINVNTTSNVGGYVAKLRVVGDLCIIRIDPPPVPYDVNWTLISPEFTSPGAGGYYAYLLLINRTAVAIAPAIARAYNSPLFFVFKCKLSDGMLIYEASPTFVNNTISGFNEQLTVGVDFGECMINYCEFGWRRWEFIAEHVYVFLNWYYAPVNGYLLPTIGGTPYKVVW